MWLSFDIWKYVDDSIMSDTIRKGQVSNIQTAVDIFATRAASVKLQYWVRRSARKWGIFGKNRTPDLKLNVINDTQIDVVSYAKILGVNISSDRKWSHHIVEVDQKARERLSCLSQLKRAGLGPSELVQFYPTYTRPITEYACPVFMIVYLYIFLAS